MRKISKHDPKAFWDILNIIDKRNNSHEVDMPIDDLYEYFKNLNLQDGEDEDFEVPELNAGNHSKWNPPKSSLDKGVGGLTLDDVSDDTVATTARYVFEEGPQTQPLVPPIYHSSTYILKTVDDFQDIVNKGGYIYSRWNNFTSDNVQSVLNNLEKGAGTLVFNSGMASITTALFGFLKSGDHVVINIPCYAGVFDIAKNIFPKFDIEVSFVQSGCDVNEYRKHVKSNTRILYGETPCNPSMDILDLAEFGKLGRSLSNVITVVDSTFAGPYIQRPIQHGIDISVHSCTKYLGGHSDLLAGSLTFRTVHLWKEAIRYQNTFGSGLSPHDASLLLRGIKTLPIRMKRHSSNGQKVAEFLEKHPKIEWVMYPGLPSHPQHAVAKKQMKLFGGMMSFEVKGGLEGGKTLVEGLNVIRLAVSLGGVESLIEHPGTMTHGSLALSDEDRRKSGISAGMVRLSIGLEDPKDLIQDLCQALGNVAC
ncbi:L-methionine gamma-lyase-like [Ylistrum balloti]|uniref:L-methionine gamma-lyase-like n=1 Tax=Ylistrum balloti TaxID=509963 RepID=UPI002905CCC4|nr:L-methionine gamma-lyase-like [Ylistrum balloti]